MRVIKENNQSFHPFTLSLKQLERSSSEKGTVFIEKAEENYSTNRRKDSPLNKILNFTERINAHTNLQDIISDFKIEVRSLTFFNEPEIFLINEKTSNCFPLNTNCKENISTFVRRNLSAGVIDWIAETGSFKIIPYGNYNSISFGLNCLIIPIFSGGKFRGVLSTITSFTEIDKDSFELQFLTTLLNIVFSKIQFELTKNELNSVYSELQSVQSKLENDYKLAALGELTYRSIEEISSPIQVILSYADLLKREYPEIDDEMTDLIKKKVYDIKSILERLVKFITTDDKAKKITPFSVNEVIEDFRKLIEPALNAENCECVLDLEENMPSILSNKNYLNQIFINGFSLINPLTEPGGGVIIQSRYSKQRIIVKMLFTKTVDLNKMNEQEVGLNILKSLMDKHEGEFLVNSDETTGSTITFSFPLIRKVRE
ncbi:HAMP domain-containing sensor histidine kinase [Ignavibacterium sp.]|uniref:HAMP domain-containing sensor histidine kinase n=1 Tax=Ignavibacterium sp. TaxID=2651167 RepID=UPI00307D179E